MQAALEETLSREELAAAASVSVRQLERLFRKHLGLSIAEYYRDLRLVHAQQLLRWSGASISEIAIASGFSSPSYFFARLQGQVRPRPPARAQLSSSPSYRHARACP